jgi:hypothetical protein
MEKEKGRMLEMMEMLRVFTSSALGQIRSPLISSRFRGHEHMTGARGVFYELDVGVLTIQEPGRKLLSQVKRSFTHLYMLELKIGLPVCLSIRSTEMAWRCHS